MNNIQPTRFFIFAGEQSGDLHGSYLMKALKKQQPFAKILGVGGPKMRAEGLETVLPMEEFEVMGLSDVIKALPKLYRHFYVIRDYILRTIPKIIILIDYPGFNLRLAKALRKKGYTGKIVHYVSPSVWAWGKHRIEEMANTLDLLLTIYPFEAAYFKHTSLPVTYVGNPLCEYIRNHNYNACWKDKLGIPKETPLIALFPGSRQTEIKRNLPMMLEAASLYKHKVPNAIFCVSGVHDISKLSDVFQNLRNALFSVPKEYTYELMRDSSVAIAKSGTVTLELALHQRPTVVIYKLTKLNRLYAKYILKLNLPHYCIVNILSEQTTFPELIEAGLSAKNIAHHLENLTNQNKKNSCQKACSEIYNALNGKHSSSEAAQAILQVIKS